MNIDYENIERDIEDGTLRRNLEEELTAGFRQIQQAGERLPVASHYAAQISEIINRNATLSEALKFELYQEVLEAVEAARVAVLGEEPLPS
jgi:flagellar biosynthesis/type III secretory pathway protein FliH